MTRRTPQPTIRRNSIPRPRVAGPCYRRDWGGEMTLRGPSTDSEAGGGAFLHHFAAETEQSRWPPTRRGRGLSGRFDHGGGLDQPAEVLLVDVTAGDRFDRA